MNTIVCLAAVAAFSFGEVKLECKDRGSWKIDVFAKDIEEECEIAAKLGMKTIILDDGWQTDDTGRGYAFCGDWQVSKRRFPDFAAHVKKVQAMGMKYMMWYSVPFVGLKSENHSRFIGKYLIANDRNMNAAVLDPRFPEVRRFLVDLYVKALNDWNIDGFKLDFIDSFRFNGVDSAVAENYAGRDEKSVAHRDTLLKGKFTPHHPELQYPWIEAEGDAERIIGVYCDNLMIPVPKDGKKLFVMNASGTDKITIRRDNKLIDVICPSGDYTEVPE